MNGMGPRAVGWAPWPLTTLLIAALLPAVAIASTAPGAVAVPTATSPLPSRTLQAPPITLAIVVRDQTPLRAGPHDAAQQQAVLWQGEVLEVRGRKLEAWQVWDHQRERGGFVEASRVQRLSMAESDAPELLAVLRFVRDAPGAEALGIGLAAAYLKAASPAAVQGEGGIEAFDAIGTMAERMAQRASAGGATGTAPPGSPPTPPSRADIALSAHLEVVAHYGVAFRSDDNDGTVRLCYDGEAFRRVLAMPGADASQQARAALSLTRPECIDPKSTVSERQRIDVWRADVLERVDAMRLPATLRNRVAMRRAGVWSALAFQRTRRGETAPARAAAERALVELATVDRAELADDDQADYNDAAMRVSASRWASAPTGVVPAGAASTGGFLTVASTTAALATPSRGVRIATATGEPGQTCVVLVDATHDARAPLARRCTFGIVWSASASLDREGNALALAVQPMEAWRELWVFRKQATGWTLDVLPPSTATPRLGYVEFAGWVPGGTQMLVARESRAESGLKRSFEVLRLDTLTAVRQATEPSVLGPFQRWQDPAWKRETVSVR